MKAKYQPHPACEIFPMMPREHIVRLAADIEANGQKEFGRLYHGMILDGRNRYAACQMAGVEMDWEEDEDPDPNFDAVQFVLTANLHRRQLKQSQRAMIAAKMANLPNGVKKGTPNGVAQDDAAKLLSVSPRAVQRAKHVLEHGSANLITAVEQCEITVSMAEKLCKKCESKSEQSSLVKQGRKAIADIVQPEVSAKSSLRETAMPDGEPDDYDYPVVEAFKHCDYRLNTLKRIADALEPHEWEWLLEQRGK